MTAPLFTTQGIITSDGKFVVLDPLPAVTVQTVPSTVTAGLVDARPVTRWIVRIPPVFWFYSGIPVGDLATRSERVIPIF